MPKQSERVKKYRADLKHAAEFTRIMGQGAEEFGGLWLQANRAAVDRACGIGVDITQPAVKHLMVSVIFRTLQHSRYFYTSEWEKRAAPAPPTPRDWPTSDDAKKFRNRPDIWEYRWKHAHPEAQMSAEDQVCWLMAQFAKECLAGAAPAGEAPPQEEK